jgi:hypothetical protein
MGNNMHNQSGYSVTVIVSSSMYYTQWVIGLINSCILQATCTDSKIRKTFSVHQIIPLIFVTNFCFPAYFNEVQNIKPAIQSSTFFVFYTYQLKETAKIDATHYTYNGVMFKEEKFVNYISKFSS